MPSKASPSVEDAPVVVAAACDGACRGNPGPGGWGALLRFSDGRVEELGGSEAQTTNNRMELSACLALLERLQQLPRAQGLAIRTDSKYLIDGFTRWINGWKRKGWRTASGSAVLNRDLWEALDAARLPDVALAHVKGHRVILITSVVMPLPWPTPTANSQLQTQPRLWSLSIRRQLRCGMC